MEISDYILVCFDHPSNTKCGGAYLNCKNNLPLRVINISHLSECQALEFNIGDKICKFLVLYKSASQSQDEFETSDYDFEMTYFGNSDVKKSVCSNNHGII